jgi:hypothetical protein
MSGSLFFSVYKGNFPNVTREAFKLRKDRVGKQIWKEIEAENELISETDCVWKPFNFQTRAVSKFDKGFPPARKKSVRICVKTFVISPL